MDTQDNDRVKTQVRTAYAKVANGSRWRQRGLRGTEGEGSLAMGYTKEDLASVPEGSDLGLGCGNLQAIAALRSGETVLDLGSGAGFDCFLAASRIVPPNRGWPTTRLSGQRGPDGGQRAARAAQRIRPGQAVFHREQPGVPDA